ncbi:MAG: hypothetical protein Kow006_24460 [Gammaproteobacteria bacterium]
MASLLGDGWKAGFAAPPPHPHAAIREAAQLFLEQNPPSVDGRIETIIGRLDSRLRLTLCQAPLQISRTPGSRPTGRFTLEVRCTSPKAWKLLLPVTVRVYAPVLTAARTLPRGTLLRKEDLRFKEQELSRLGYGYLRRLEEAVGKELRRSLHAGATLTPAQLTARRLIKRGQRVTILANSGGIEVRMSGEALSDGARDERIRVRNRKTRRIVEGVVESSGVVRVNL